MVLFFSFLEEKRALAYFDQLLLNSHICLSYFLSPWGASLTAKFATCTISFHFSNGLEDSRWVFSTSLLVLKEWLRLSLTVINLCWRRLTRGNMGQEASVLDVGTWRVATAAICENRGRVKFRGSQKALES